MNSQPQRKASDQSVYKEMFEAILAQRLLPGTKLKEDEIAQIFKVSRTTVRRVLLRLSNDGIVDIERNKGASVARISAQRAHEIIQVRRLIEAEVIREATRNASSKDLENLRALVSKEEDRFNQSNRSGGIRLSGDFHIELAVISGNETLTDIMTRLVPQTSLVIAQYEKPGITNCSHEEHFALIDAIEQKNAKLAVKLMDHHLLGIENKLQLDEGESAVNLADVFLHVNSG